MSRPSRSRGPLRSLTMLVGKLGGGLRYNSRLRVTRGGRPYHLRRRRWFAPLLIAVVNQSLAWSRDGVRVLGDQAWFDRERRMWRAIHGLEVRVEDGALLTPELPGKPLDRALAEEANATPVRAAAAALAKLHEAYETHGDANAENVLWDAATQSAHWIDFDTAHRRRFSPGEARADDIRVLAASAMRRFAVEDAAVVAQAIREGYGSLEEIARAAARLQRQSAKPTAFEIAQGSAEPEKLQALANQLRSVANRESAYTAAM